MIYTEARWLTRCIFIYERRFRIGVSLYRSSNERVFPRTICAFPIHRIRRSKAHRQALIHVYFALAVLRSCVSLLCFHQALCPPSRVILFSRRVRQQAAGHGKRRQRTRCPCSTCWRRSRATRRRRGSRAAAPSGPAGFRSPSGRAPRRGSRTSF